MLVEVRVKMLVKVNMLVLPIYTVVYYEQPAGRNTQQ